MTKGSLSSPTRASSTAERFAGDASVDQEGGPVAATSFFHIDRGAELELGQTLGLDHGYQWEPELELLLTELYPDGLSHHGHVYSQGGVEGYDPEFGYEAFFELVRLSFFPDCPSRFQSIFGFRKRERAEEFIEKYADEETVLWEVHAEGAFMGDMRLVHVDDFAQGIFNAAHYWQGTTWRDDPYWEYLLEPPVQVVDRIDIYNV